MDCIPDDKILKYNPDTLSFMRKTYNLDKPGQMDEAIDLLDAWLKKQSHLVKKDFSREYLERVIILQKGSIEKAKSQIEKISTLRTLIPHFFTKFDAKNDFNDIIGKYTYSSLMPRLTEKHHRMFLLTLESGQYSPNVFFQMYRLSILVNEYLKANDYSNGIISIVDFRKISNVLEFIPKFNLFDMKQMATIIMDGYGTRLQKFILISKSNAIDVMVKIFKQIFPEKLAQRIFVVRDIEELHQHVPKELLPADYGGNEKVIAALCNDFLEALASEENIKYFKEMSEACTIEAMRTTKLNDDILGIEGTFRTLNLD